MIYFKVSERIQSGLECVRRKEVKIPQKVCTVEERQTLREIWKHQKGYEDWKRGEGEGAQKETESSSPSSSSSFVSNVNESKVVEEKSKKNPLAEVQATGLSWFELRERRKAEERKRAEEKRQELLRLAAEKAKAKAEEPLPARISWTQLKALSRCLRHLASLGKLTLGYSWTHELIEGAETDLERPKRSQLSAAAKAKLEQLRAAYSNVEYATIVKTAAEEAETERAEMKTLGHQMGVGFNVIITMITCFVAGYWIFSSYNRVAGIIGGLACMIIALLVEGSLLMTIGFRIDRSISKQQQRDKRSLMRHHAFPRRKIQ